MAKLKVSRGHYEVTPLEMQDSMNPIPQYIEFTKVAQPADPSANTFGRVFYNTADNRLSFLRRNDGDTAYEVIDLEGGGGGSSPLTTKGDLYGFTTVDARIPVGTDGQALLANSGQTTGVIWKTLELDDLSDVTIGTPSANTVLKWSGTQWVDGNVVNANIDAGANIDWTKINKTGSSLDDLDDTLIGTPSVNTVLKWVGSDWVDGLIVNANVDAGANIDGSKLDVELDDLTDVLIGTPSANTVLKWSGSAWVDGNVLNANIDAGANIDWTKINKTGSKLDDIGDCTIGVTPSANTVLKEFSGGWVDGLILNANIDAGAGIAGSKINMSIDELNDVTIGTPASNTILKWSGSAWVDGNVVDANVDAGANIAWTKINKTGSSLDDLGDTLIGTPSANTILKWSGSAWVDGLVTNLNLSPTVISSQTLVTAVAGDMLLLWDVTDSTLKRVNANDFLGGGGGSTFPDDDFQIYDDVTPTKILQFNMTTGSVGTSLINISTSAVRTWTLPDITGTLASLAGTQTFTGAKTFNATTNLFGLLNVNTNSIQFDAISPPSNPAVSELKLFADDTEVGDPLSVKHSNGGVTNIEASDIPVPTVHESSQYDHQNWISNAKNAPLDEDSITTNYTAILTDQISYYPVWIDRPINVERMGIDIGSLDADDISMALYSNRKDGQNYPETRLTSSVNGICNTTGIYSLFFDYDVLEAGLYWVALWADTGNTSTMQQHAQQATTVVGWHTLNDTNGKMFPTYAYNEPLHTSSVLPATADNTMGTLGLDQVPTIFVKCREI
jgi:hypothetical protein